MSLLHGFLGNASEVKKEEIEEDISPILIKEEKIESAFKLIRDLIVFTDKRLILLDKQGLTGHKKEYFSLSYKHISFYTIESAGHLDTDSELKIWISGHQTPIKKEFKRGANIIGIQKLLAEHILK
jgi:hypothetical protein